MHAAVLPLGGGVSHCDAHRLRGQSTIEYVLLIAIVALVVIVAGPGVASAIRNQFSTVTDAIGSGTAGENFYDAVDLPDPQNGTAFAVYSEDDHSLMFYKRRGVPAVGDMFNYRRVTEVYTGFETDKYGVVKYGPSNDGALSDVTLNTPWCARRNEILSVAVIDSNISPKSVEYWFENLSHATTFRLSKLNVSKTDTLHNLFASDYSVKEIDVSGWDVSHVWDYSHVFIYCPSLEKLDLSSWETASMTKLHNTFGGDSALKTIKLGSGWDTSKVIYFTYTFSECSNLVLDCSDWDVSSMPAGINPDNGVYYNTCFNIRAPNVIRPSTWK